MRPTPGSVRRNTLRTPPYYTAGSGCIPQPTTSGCLSRSSVFRFSVPRITFPGESYRYASGRAAGGRRRIGAGDFYPHNGYSRKCEWSPVFSDWSRKPRVRVSGRGGVLPLDNLDAAGTNFTDLVLGINDRTHGQKKPTEAIVFFSYCISLRLDLRLSTELHFVHS